MARRLWIAGLTFALLLYGGLSMLILVTGLKHRHLNGTGFFALLVNGYIAWFTFNYLIVKIRNQPYVPPPNDEPIEIPRLL